MSFEEFRYRHDEIPELDSEFMKDFAKELYEELQYYKEGSQELRKVIWPACDKAWQCIRELPKSDGMAWANKSEMGETDVRDAVEFMANTISLAAMPRTEQWQEPIALDAEKQGDLKNTRDYLRSMHRKADTRGTYEQHIRQLLIRGTSAINWTWRKTYRMKRLGPAETLRAVADISKVYGAPLEYRDLKRARVPELRFSGPVLKVVDMHDIFLDPAANLSRDEDVNYVFREFYTLEDLEAATDADGKPMFSNYEGMTGMSIEEINTLDIERYNSAKLLGIDPMTKTSRNTRFIPVYCFHKQVRRFRDKQFVDCYFYLAMDRGENSYRLISAVENPSDYGNRSLFLDVYSEWLNCAYGIGAVEKSLNAWQHKNVLSALTLQAQLTSVFPAWIVIAGMLLDDRRLRVGPGEINPINLRPSVGTRFMEPVPTAKDGAQIGELAQRWEGQKILGQMGAYGAMLNDPTRSITDQKTATEINTESSTGSVNRDSFIERITIRSLEPLCNALLDAAKQYAGDEMVYEKAEAGQFGMGKVTRDELMVADRVVVTGFHGMINKANEIRELNEALAVMAQAMTVPGMMAQLAGPYMETVFQLLGRLGLQNLEKYKGSPVEVMMQDPMVQQWIGELQAAAARQGAESMAEEMTPMPPLPEEAGEMLNVA
jgi:hypothetical protein